MFSSVARQLGVLCACLGLAVVQPQVAAAQSAPTGLHPDRYSAIVIDHRSGNVLTAVNADEQRHPASLTKMMTLYMLFEAIRDGRVGLDTPIRFSAEAASRPPSKLGVPVGGTISAETAILSLVTRSANDVASAVGEHLSGSEEAFARAMTNRARSLGMTRTTFRNASGLPDWEQVTTARDMATLGRRLIADFPQFYRYFGVTHFAHGRQMIRNHNGMLLDYEGADGIKTGFINASGFNIVTSAQRDGVRLVGAVFGGQSWYARNRHMADLLDEGFDRMGIRSRPSLVAQARPNVAGAREATARATQPATRTASVTPAPRAAGRPAVQGQLVRVAAPAPRTEQRRPVRLAQTQPAQGVGQPSQRTHRSVPVRPAREAAPRTMTRSADAATRAGRG